MVIEKIKQTIERENLIENKDKIKRLENEIERMNKWKIARKFAGDFSK